MRSSLVFLVAAALATLLGADARAQLAEYEKLSDAAAVVRHFSSDDEDAIPVELLERAHGIAVFPDVIRGGFIFGARRGRGALVLRTADGGWSNPAIMTLTGGSIGLQIGAEAMDVVLVFANDRSVQNIRSGKFTLGGDATAIAGPVGRHATLATTFRAEVYGYIESSGLFAGATFEGTRLALDGEANARLYSQSPGNRPLEAPAADVPAAVERFLTTLADAERENPPAVTRSGVAGSSLPEEAAPAGDEVRTFPLEGVQ